MKLQTVLGASLFIVCCVSLGFWTSTRALAKENSSGANVWMVDKVEIAILKSNPPKLSIIATGRVRTAGWTNPNLSRLMYVMPPHDGIQDFMFSATAPKGTPAEVISHISATAIMDDLPSWVRGVRVHGASNTKEAFLSKSTDGGNSGSKCEKRGTLETEIVATGGETTGVVVHTEDGDWDLDFRDNKELDKLADTLNKKAVIVSGICRKIEGVEKPERNIIEVTHLAPADAH